MAKKVRFEELAVAGMRRLFSEETLVTSATHGMALALAFDPAKNAHPCAVIPNGNFFLRGFFAGFELRVMFEVGEDITVWSVTRATQRIG
jgi:hypothetical protein